MESTSDGSSVLDTAPKGISRTKEVQSEIQYMIRSRQLQE